MLNKALFTFTSLSVIKFIIPQGDVWGVRGSCERGDFTQHFKLFLQANLHSGLKAFCVYFREDMPLDYICGFSALLNILNGGRKLREVRRRGLKIK